MRPRLPEDWALPTYLSVIVQLANIGPIMYIIFQRLLPNIITERRVCFGMLFIGTLASILMAQFWDKTAVMFGELHSISLFVLTFCLALVDSLSSLVCLPFMAVFKPKYTSSYMIGEGLSGLLPSIISLIQSVDEDHDENCSSNSSRNSSDVISTPIGQPLITIELFFYMLCAMMVTSAIGFIVLNYHPIAKPEYDISDDFQKDISTENIEIKSIQTIGIDNTGSSLKDIEKDYYPPTKTTYFLMFLVQMYISGLQYGIMNALQSYSCLPYGNLVYHMATVLSCLASPVMAITYVFLPTQNKRILYPFTFLATAISGYLMTTAAMSPDPPLKGFLVGKIIVVSGWILFSCLISYVKVAVACLQRDISHKAMFWGGVGIQAGGSLGALLMFFLIVVFKMFSSCD